MEEKNFLKNHISIFQNISPSHQFLVWVRIKLFIRKLGLRAEFPLYLTGSLQENTLIREKLNNLQNQEKPKRKEGLQLLLLQAG